MKKILTLMLLLITAVTFGQTLNDFKVIKKLTGGGADSIYINGTWYNIPADSVTITAIPSSNANNADSLGGFTPAYYQDTIFYNGTWLGQGDTLYLGFDATAISTTANINSFVNMQNVTDYVDSLELNFQKNTQLEVVGTLFAGAGTTPNSRSVITYSVNDTDYIAVANASPDAGGIRIYNAQTFAPLAVVARNGIEFLVYDEVANRIYATTKSNILYSYNYIGGDEIALNYTATTISEITAPVMAREGVDSSSVWFYGRESTNLWRAYRITIDNVSKAIQTTVVSDSIVESVTLDQVALSVTKDTLLTPTSSGARNRILQAYYNAGVITHSAVNVGGTAFISTNQRAQGCVRVGASLYVNWIFALAKHTIESLATKEEWAFGAVINETNIFYLEDINRLAVVRRAFNDNPQQIYLVDLENPQKHSVTQTHATGLVGQCKKYKYLFGNFTFTTSFVVIYKYK